VNLREALRIHRACFSSFHLSDNTRHFPGFGALDFAAIIGMLDELDYQGKLAIEGNVRTSFAADVEVAMRCLGPLLARKTTAGPNPSLARSPAKPHTAGCWLPTASTGPLPLAGAVSFRPRSRYGNQKMAGAPPGSARETVSESPAGIHPVLA